MNLKSSQAFAAALDLHSASQACRHLSPNVWTPGLTPSCLLPPSIYVAWNALNRVVEVDHGLLCPAFSFILHSESVFLREGQGKDLPLQALPWQDDPETVALCYRGLDLLPITGHVPLSFFDSTAHQRLLLAQLRPTQRAMFGHLLRRGRVCILLAFLEEEKRFRVTAAAIQH